MDINGPLVRAWTSKHLIIWKTLVWRGLKKGGVWGERRRVPGGGTTFLRREVLLVVSVSPLVETPYITLKRSIHSCLLRYVDRRL